MKLVTKTFQIITAEEGKYLISKEEKALLEKFNNQILPGHNPVYHKEIAVAADYTQEQMLEDYIEEEIETAE